MFEFLRQRTSTLIPLQIVEGKWSYPPAIPTFEQLHTDRIVTQPDSSKPLIAEAGATIKVNVREALVEAHRATSDDPRQAFLASPDSRPPTTLIASFVDLEPNPSLQLLWGLTNRENITLAIDALAKEFAIQHVLVAAYFNIPGEWLSQLQLMAGSLATPARVYRVGPRYPVADARLLKHELAHRHADRTAVLDAVTLNEIGHFLRNGDRPRNVPIALHDAGAARTHYCVVPRGTRMNRILAALDVAVLPDACLREGAVMQDRCIDRSTPADSGELSFHVHPPEGQWKSEPCVRCGWCVEVCPTRLAPAELYDAIMREDAKGIAREHLDSCVECGLCTAICPSQLPLHHRFSARLRNEHPATPVEAV